MDIKEEVSFNAENITYGLRKALPGASAYMLEALSCCGIFEDVSAPAVVVENLKKELGTQTQPQFDDLIAAVLLRRQSIKAAKLKLETKPLTDGPDRTRANAAFIENLFKDKKIPPSIYMDLLAAYAQEGGEGRPPCLADFSAAFESNLKDLNKINDNPAQNTVLACRVLLYILTKEEAAFAAQTAAAVKYPLEDEDLLTITLRYAGQKTPAETAEIFETILKRLPYLDDPVENLGLAARVMADGRLQALQDADVAAARRKDKILFMRAVAADKFFAGYEDEITNKFFGVSSAQEVSSIFRHILKELPHDKDIYENADTAVKVLLKKLPLQDAVNQARFKKGNSGAALATGLEQEAFESYLGVKNKEEVFAFFKQQLADYNFWKESEEKHCYALSVLVARLNGKLSPQSADLALFLLEAACPEESIDIITAGLTAPVEKNAVLEAYEKFYAQSGDHCDAARRAVNMLQ